MMEIYLDEVPNQEFEKYFKFVENIASGAFGKVIRAIDLKTNEEVAVKIIDKDVYLKRLNMIKQEINILQQLKHKNIVNFLGFVDANTKLYIVMNLLSGGTVKNLIDNRIKIENKLSEEECSIIVKKLLEAVKCLHEREIIHRDIKPENIMFESSDDLTSLKLIDFGLSSQHFENIFLFDLCGTLIYMAPEQLEKRAYSKPIDMWSCGMILYILLNNGKHPIFEKGMNTKLFISKLKTFKCENENKVSKMAQSLLKKLLEQNPSRRYTVDKALNHPWITREKYQNIPETYFELWRLSSIKRKFKQAFGVTLFLMNFNYKNKSKKNSFLNKNKEKNLLQYALLANKISKMQNDKFNIMRDKHFDPMYSSGERTEKVAKSDLNEKIDKNIKINAKLEKINTFNSPADKQKKINTNTLNSNYSPNKIYKTQTSSRNDLSNCSIANITHMTNQINANSNFSYNSVNSPAEPIRYKKSPLPIRVKISNPNFNNLNTTNNDNINISINNPYYRNTLESLNFSPKYTDSPNKIDYFPANSGVISPIKQSKIITSLNLNKPVKIINKNQDEFKLKLKQLEVETESNDNENKNINDTINIKIDNTNNNKQIVLEGNNKENQRHELKNKMNSANFNKLKFSNNKIVINKPTKFINPNAEKNEDLFIEKLNLSNKFFDKFTFSKINLDNKCKLINDMSIIKKNEIRSGISLTTVVKNSNLHVKRSTNKKVSNNKLFNFHEINLSSVNESPDLVLPQIKNNTKKTPTTKNLVRPSETKPSYLS